MLDLLLVIVGAAQISPIHVRAQVFAADCARGFAVDFDSKRHAKLLADADCLSQVANAGLAARAKTRLFVSGKPVEVFA